jgi:hypothetical protein
MIESRYRRFMNRILMMLHIIKRERPVTADEIQAAIDRAIAQVKKDASKALYGDA